MSQPQVFRPNSVRRQAILTILVLGVNAWIWTEIAFDSTLLFGLSFGLATSAGIVNSGLQRVVLTDTEIAVHHPFMFMVTRVPLGEIVDVELPRGTSVWNVPILRRQDGTAVRLTPLTYGSRERRKARATTWAAEEIARAARMYNAAKG